MGLILGVGAPLGAEPEVKVWAWQGNILLPAFVIHRTEKVTMAFLPVCKKTTESKQTEKGNSPPLPEREGSSPAGGDLHYFKLGQRLLSQLN